MVKINDVNIPIKMKIQNIKKDSIYNKFSNTTNIEFNGDIILEVFGKKEKIGYIMTHGGYKTMPEIIKRVKEVFLSHIKYFNFEIRDW